MKTTIDISDELFRNAKALARQRETTLRALVEEGLRRVLRDETERPPFVLRDASVDGNGYQADVADRSWEEILDLSYRGRGS